MLSRPLGCPVLSIARPPQDPVALAPRGSRKSMFNFSFVNDGIHLGENFFDGECLTSIGFFLDLVNHRGEPTPEFFLLLQQAQAGTHDLTDIVVSALGNAFARETLKLRRQMHIRRHYDLYVKL